MSVPRADRWSGDGTAFSMEKINNVMIGAELGTQEEMFLRDKKRGYVRRKEETGKETGRVDKDN